MIPRSNASSTGTRSSRLTEKNCHKKEFIKTLDGQKLSRFPLSKLSIMPETPSQMLNQTP